MGSRSRDRVAAIRHLVAARLPDHQVHSVVQVGEGSDHHAYEVNGELIVRCSKEPDPAARAEHVDREARLLAAVAAIAPLPVPAPSLIIPEQGCLAYRKLRGVPLLDLPRQQRSAHNSTIAAMLGELLTALHAAPLEQMAALVGVDDQPLVQWQREAAQTYATVAGEVPVVYRRPVKAFLDAPPPAGGWAPVFSHNDLGIEHVLVDPGTAGVAVPPGVAAQRLGGRFIHRSLPSPSGRHGTGAGSGQPPGRASSPSLRYRPMTGGSLASFRSSSQPGGQPCRISTLYRHSPW